MTTLKLPSPKDICDLIVESLPDTLSESSKKILTATCRNLANENISPNELYNSVLSVLPTIQAFFTDLQVETYVKDTFRGYSEIWVPVQFLMFVLLIFVVVVVMIMTGKLQIGYGILIIIVSTVIITIIGIAEFDSLVNYLNSREVGFTSLINSLYTKYKTQALLTLAEGYIVGSSMGVYSPDGPFNSESPVSLGPTFVVLDSTVTTYNLTNPYAKITIFKTSAGGTYPVFLFEESVVAPGSDPPELFKQMIKTTYPKYQYMVNYGPGDVYISNASNNFTYDNNVNYPSVNQGTGVTISVGQCRAFVNINYTMFGPSFAVNGSVSTSNWVLVS